MIAAIYARKSTEQNGGAAEACGRAVALRPPRWQGGGGGR